MTGKRLRDLPYVDMYVRLDRFESAHFLPFAKDMSTVQSLLVPPDYSDDLNNLFQLLHNTLKNDEASIIHDGVRHRVTRMRLADGSVWTALRRIALDPPPLEALGFRPQILPHLSGLGTRGGLIIISGSTGQGKTTTAASLLTHYLDQHGGIAVTIEDPVEFQIMGNRGRAGYCYQVEIDNDDDWAVMLKRSLRWHPRYLFVGEIRTPEAASQVLRAATSGHLVITTLHSGSIEEALEGLLFLAEGAVHERAAILLATSLTAVIHQNLEPSGPYLKMLITEDKRLGDPIRNMIRSKQIAALGTHIDRTHARIFGSTTG
jgi:twitching motility protein PilT